MITLLKVIIVVTGASNVIGTSIVDVLYENRAGAVVVKDISLKCTDVGSPAFPIKFFE